jgi:hypothetical protein
MEFGPALDLLRAGVLMVRRLDQGRYQWVALRTGYPDGIAVNENTALSFGVESGTWVVFAPYFQAMRWDGQVVSWSASNDDVLANDWLEVTPRA